MRLHWQGLSMRWFMLQDSTQDIKLIQSMTMTYVYQSLILQHSNQASRANSPEYQLILARIQNKATEPDTDAPPPAPAQLLTLLLLVSTIIEIVHLFEHTTNKSKY